MPIDRIYTLKFSEYRLAAITLTSSFEPVHSFICATRNYSECNPFIVQFTKELNEYVQCKQYVHALQSSAEHYENRTSNNRNSRPSNNAHTIERTNAKAHTKENIKKINCRLLTAQKRIKK